MKFIRIFLLALIIIGIGLLFTQDSWVPRVVEKIMEREGTTPAFILERPTASSTIPSTPESSKPTTHSYGEVVLKIGETAKFSDLTLTLVRVFDDSRCPTGVQCIWAGTVKAEVKIVSGVGTSTSVIELGGSATTEAEEISFLSATPYPKEGVSTVSGEYQLTLRVEKRP